MMLASFDLLFIGVWLKQKEVVKELGAFNLTIRDDGSPKVFITVTVK